MLKGLRNIPTILLFPSPSRNLGKIVLDSSLITLTEQRRNRLRELILKTTKNLENVAKLNYDFCQQLEDVSLALAQ